ncbi:MAG: glycosyltransferase [Sphingomonas sp.]
MIAPRVSIAMATYNGGPYIAEQLASFVAQHRQPDELVVCDDGSSDDTVEQIERFAQTAPFAVRIARNAERLGYSDNFAKAISLCSGDIIFISDQDDRWFATKIATVERKLQERPDLLMVVNDQEIVENGEALGTTIFRNNRRMGVAESEFSAGSCTALRQEFREIVLPIPKGVAYDAWIGLLGHYLGVKGLIDESLQIYRRHGGNATDPVAAGRSASALTLVSRFGLADAHDGWQRHIERLALFEQRIRDRDETVAALAGPGAAARALRLIAEEKQRFVRRLDLLAYPRLRRLPRIISLWGRGFYAPFFGYKSAIKDMIRP